MALGKSGNGPKAIYLQVAAKTAEMTRWVKEGDGGHEERVGYVTGKLTGLEVREKNWASGDTSYELHVKLQDPSSGERYVMTLGAESRMASRLVGQLNAADLTQEHYFSPYMIKEGDKLKDGAVASTDSALFSIKPILGVDGDQLKLGEGVRPYYGEQYGSELPKSVAVMDAKGKPLLNNGQPVFDSSERKELTVALIGAVQAKIEAANGNAQQQTGGEGDDDGIDANEATRAASRVRQG